MSTGFEEDIQRRDSLHAVINDLPDPNYATLRALVLVSLYPFLPHESFVAKNTHGEALGLTSSRSSTEYLR